MNRYEPSYWAELLLAVAIGAVLGLSFSAFVIALIGNVHAQTFPIAVPLPAPVQITIACPGGSPAAPVGNTFTCPGGVTPPQPQCPSPPGPGPCSDPGPISCPGFANTRVLNASWANPVRLYTKDAGGFGPNDAVVVIFKTGSVGTPNNNLGRIGGAEYQDGPSTRLSALSPKPCDWSAQEAQGALSNGTSVSVPFSVKPGTGFGYYPELNQVTTYYYNVKNDPFGSCAQLPVGSTCNMALDLTHPPGL